MTEEIVVIKKRVGRPVSTPEEKLLYIQKNRERALLRIKNLYQNDPVYRLHHIEKCKAYYHKNRELLKALKESINGSS